MEQAHIDILRRAYLTALKKAKFITSEEEIEERLFPIWERAVHRIILRIGCPCQKGNKAKCFLLLSREKKEALMSDNENLSFSQFISLFMEAQQKVLKSMVN